MPRKELEALQLERLRWTVDYCIRNIPFYAKRLAEAKVTPEKLKSLSDVQYIPYTTKDDIRDTYPNGLFGVPMNKIVRIHASSGTTGKPTVVGYTRNDLNNWADLIARLAVAVGVTEDDVFQISFGYGLFTGALGLHYGLERIGCSVIPASSGNTVKQLMLLRDLKVTGLVATPSYALYMSEAAKEAEFPMSDYHLRIGLFGSEGCTPEMRTQIEQNWGLFATDNYGMSELMGPGVSGECYLRRGLHIAEDHFLPEIIDPVTLERKDAGEQGELVITTLTKEGIPMLRYRTKDVSRLNYEPCECGRTNCRMDKVTGRTDDMLKIRGVNVFPSQIESVLVGMEHIGPHYSLIVRREGFADTLEVKVELVSGELLESYSELERLQRRIHDNLKSVLGIETKITLCEPKTLERFQGKAKRVVDLRHQREE